MIRASAKYAAFVRVAAVKALREPGELYGRVVFFAVILGVFASLWQAVAEAGLPLASDPRTLVWYLAATEWILLSAPPVHLDLQESIRRGDVACQLGRPVSFAGAAFAEGLGLLAVRAPVLGVTAFACPWWFTSWTPPFPVFLRVVPLGLVAAAVITGLCEAIGLLAFWLQDVSPVYWVWQKLLFVLGGLMLPLQVYPEFIRRAAAFTPFPSVLGGPASFVLQDAGADTAALAWNLALWGSLTALSVWWLFRRAVRALTINGG
jgi:ABC-2 type transport system permease protein